MKCNLYFPLLARDRNPPYLSDVGETVSLALPEDIAARLLLRLVLLRSDLLDVREVRGVEVRLLKFMVMFICLKLERHL